MSKDYQRDNEPNGEIGEDRGLSPGESWAEEQDTLDRMERERFENSDPADIPGGDLPTPSAKGVEVILGDEEPEFVDVRDYETKEDEEEEDPDDRNHTIDSTQSQ